MGGRRRRRTQKTKKMRGGMGYGFGGPMGTNGAVWNPSWGGEVTKSGQPVYDTASRPAVGGRRKSRKGSRKVRRRTMRGGGLWQTVGPVGHGFAGEGARGLAIHGAYPSKVPPPTGGYAQNFDGAYRP